MFLFFFSVFPSQVFSIKVELEFVYVFYVLISECYYILVISNNSSSDYEPDLEIIHAREKMLVNSFYLV